ncbi:hypothetical protein JCM21714_924 [Gracilibacillus boraciitolerans JCM 21714]|uniref:Uncharacterized protein n=1 Tax=Gracilibacillus boraciitolerans JCM 21714 TaxID=1298598 RepID=W4VFI8_9BACI|nr:hypothetical protein [Gracilibacillus boraciitolerans]GAE91952.1 hypothetical protein JCM21714_924 [Gracilibacillus boraciitolerans JCM 21714]
MYTLEFEDATITYHPEENQNKIIAKWHDGREKIYIEPEDYHVAKLEVMYKALQDPTKSILCGPEAAKAHVNAIYGMHQSVKKFLNFQNIWSPITKRKN